MNFAGRYHLSFMACQLARATAFFEADSTQRCVRELEAARSNLAHLRRTQTAALRHIDDALASAKGGAR